MTDNEHDPDDAPLTPRTIVPLLAQYAVLCVVALWFMVSVVLAPAGIAIFAFVTLALGWELLRMAWHGLETFADWFHAGNRND